MTYLILHQSEEKQSNVIAFKVHECVHACVHALTLYIQKSSRNKLKHLKTLCQDIQKKAWYVQQHKTSEELLPSPTQSQPHPWSEQRSFGWARTAEWNLQHQSLPHHQPPLTWATFPGRAQDVMLLLCCPASVHLQHDASCVMLRQRGAESAERSSYTSLTCGEITFPSKWDFLSFSPWLKLLQLHARSCSSLCQQQAQQARGGEQW